MSLVAFFLLASLPSSQANTDCEKPLKEIQLKIQVTSENLAMASEPALPGRWPASKKVVECKGATCKVKAEQGVRISYEPYSFYADDLGIVGYPNINAEEESQRLASLEWQYQLQRESCKK